MVRDPEAERACADALAALRWPEGLVCACGGRRFGRIATRPRVFQCVGCRKQHSVTAGTALHGCHLSLATWFRALIFEQHGVSARRLQRELGVTYETAFQALHRLRWALGLDDPAPPLSPTDDLATVPLHTRRPWLQPPWHGVPLYVAVRDGEVVSYGIVDRPSLWRRVRPPPGLHRSTPASIAVRVLRARLRDLYGTVSRRWLERYLDEQRVLLARPRADALCAALLRAPRRRFADLGPPRRQPPWASAGGSRNSFDSDSTRIITAMTT